ncbi:MAG: putative glycoside hydrolase [Anaerolineales bacterium]
MKTQFVIGKYRPIYLWAGPGTIRMNKIKFMDYPVDEVTHSQAHTSDVAQLVVDEMNANWIHLMYDWGFPPEIELEDWEDFRKAAVVYHQAGSPVFAYIQTSNCVFDGSFRQKNWYALDRKGKKIFYYSGRYMVDWTHPEWIQHLKDMVKGAIERGADGIFFDNPWYGEQPNDLMGAWLGGAGCYCERCQNLFTEETGHRIPEKILPDHNEVATYLRWRADQVTQTLHVLADYARSLKPNTPISVNDYDVTMRNSYLIYGIDVEALARVQDVVMVENFALPKWQNEPYARLLNNALTIRNLREFVGQHAHLNVLSYDVGIGFDPVYPPRRHQQGIGEAAACGTSMTIKGTEYNDGNCMTLLTDPRYHAQHTAIGAYHHWLEDHQEVFQDRTNLAPIGLLHPEADLWRNWMEMAAVYYGAGQVLTWAGLPWRVIREGADLGAVSTLFTFTPSQRDFASQSDTVKQIHVPDLPGWAWRKPSLVARGGVWHTLVESLGLFLLHSYHSSKFARRLMDHLNLAKAVTQTALFNLPKKKVMEVLLAALPEEVYPRVFATSPVLMEVWEKAGKRQVHLLNYGQKPQKITLQFAESIRAQVLSPDNKAQYQVQGQQIQLLLDIYSILLLD